MLPGHYKFPFASLHFFFFLPYVTSLSSLFYRALSVGEFTLLAEFKVAVVTSTLSILSQQYPGYQVRLWQL